VTDDLQLGIKHELHVGCVEVIFAPRTTVSHLPRKAAQFI